MGRKITALLPYYGAARLIAPRVGERLVGCDTVLVPFMGGGSELAHIPARTLLVSDLNRFAINLANVLAHPAMGPELIKSLRRLVFHPDALRAAQERCRAFDGADGWTCDIDAARAYFVCCWMTRSGSAGTGGEFTGALSVRWSGGGGDSVTRFRSAVEGLRDWRRVRDRATFVCEDAFELLERMPDRAGNGCYIDCPWPDDGDCYTHPFTEGQQRKLAARLAEFSETRVVVRFGEHPLVAELYPEAAGWRWVRLAGRTQTNAAKAEVLLVRNGGDVSKEAA